MKKIETERYILRIPKIEDAEEIYEKWGTDKEKIAQYMERKVYKNVIEAKALILAAIQETENGAIFWIIEDKNTNQIAGYIKTQIGSPKDKMCEIAFYFLDGYRLEGTPKEVLEGVIDYIFIKQDYETIVAKYYAGVLRDREMVHKVLTSVGMTREGILRHRLINEDGEKVNQYIYSILKEEWENRRKQKDN